MKKGKIKSIRKINNPKHVYDISVKDNHNFFANNVLVKNCHHIPSKTCVDIAKMAKDAYYRIGVSATPWRDGGDDMLIEAVLSKRHNEFNISASYLTELGYLVPCTIYFVPIKKVYEGKNYHKLYNDAVVSNMQRNQKAVKIAVNMRNKKDATILILVARVEHGEMLKKMLEKYLEPKSFNMNVENPVNNKKTLVRVNNIEFLSGQDKPLKRKAVLEATREKKCNILICTTIADEGLDVSSIDTVILCGCGKSSTRAFQRIGRALRLHTNQNGTTKQKAWIFDFADSTPTLKRHFQIRKRLYKQEPAWELKTLNID